MSGNGRGQQTYVPAPRSERPHLLAFNRRLRHLHGITLRNLVLFPAPKRPRGRTIDDEALPFTLSSPRKLLALNEAHKLTQSRSSSNLKEQAVGKASVSPSKGSFAQANGHADPHQLRSHHQRRGTFDWASNSPRQRQQRIEDAITRHMADVFFSLHAGDGEDPVYVSEVVERSMNPEYRFFDLEFCGPTVSRSHLCALRFFAKSENDKDWVYFLDLQVNLEWLQCLGKTLDRFPHPLPDNCVLFHFSDGIYAHLPDIIPPSTPDQDRAILSKPPTLPSPLQTTQTCTYDTLMRLSTLDSCIQDALATRQTLTSQINALLDSTSPKTAPLTTLPSSRSSLTSAHRAKSATLKQISSLKTTATNLRDTLSARRTSMRHNRATQTTALSALHTHRASLSHSHYLQTRIQSEIAAQRRRIAADLQSIYPIDPLPGKKPASLAFAIRGLPLPNSVFSGPSLREDHLSAALGYTAHLALLLSAYLATPLPYPITPRASSSSILDPVSALALPRSASQTQARTFPLHVASGSRGARLVANSLGGSSFYRFEYGVFLLNKDVEVLAGRVGVRVVDVRNTLPNLKHVLFVVGEGGVVPGRRVGGVRGLFDGRSREGSLDGERGGVGEELRARVERETGDGKGKARAEDEIGEN